MGRGWSEIGPFGLTVCEVGSELTNAASAISPPVPYDPAKATGQSLRD